MKLSSTIAAGIFVAIAGIAFSSALAETDQKDTRTMRDMDRSGMQEMMKRCKSALANPDEHNKQTREYCEMYRW
jgi:hypothetical protein